jgi:CRISPR-associated protein Csd1
MVGVSHDENKMPLLPICHTTQKAHIEITIDEHGKFIKARSLGKDEVRTTIIPCTEKSAGRTSGGAPHPLCDKLQYVAQDYENYGGDKKIYHESYRNNLEAWCNSTYSHPKAIAVLKYVRKGKIIEDLIKNNVLYAKQGTLLKKWDGNRNETPTIFSILQNQEWQADAFIRWIVDKPNEKEIRAWDDESLWKIWIQYYFSIKREKKGLCYTTGKDQIVSNQHPKKIRNEADGAKIISSGKSIDSKGKEKVDDSCGFTFLGRFWDADQAAGISLEVSQKAHLALRWLIDRQGYKGKDGQAIVAWATSGTKIIQPTDDPLAILGFNELPSNESKVVSTAQDLAIKLKKKIAGYRKELGNSADVVVMGLDAATPGRMSMTFYKELKGSDFLKRIDDWHEHCAWIHNYGYDKETKQHFTFVGAPAPDDIAEAAYGRRVDDKLTKATVARLLPCIIDGQQIPRDIVESVIRRACNRIAQKDSKDKHEREWNKTLSIACSLYKKYSKEDYNMALDENRNTRDYLYGRLLAIADRLEGHALYKAKEKRDTNAARYMQLFAEHPFKTWRQIELSLSPYKARLGGAGYYTGLIDNVMCKFAPDDFKNDKPLGGEFLLGFHCQRAELCKGKNEEPEEMQVEE